MEISIKEIKDESINFGKPYIEINFKGMLATYYGIEEVTIIEEDGTIELMGEGIEYLSFDNTNDFKEIKRQLHEFKIIKIDVFQE